MRALFEEEFAAGEQVPEAAAPDKGSPALRAPHESAPGAGLTAAQPAGSAPPPALEELAPEPAQSVTGAPLPSLGTEQRPACLEPWKSLYILRRGVLPCCYGGTPIAEMKDYRQAWNSPLMQSIRAELLQGRFHDYCLRSPACPIVRKSEEAATLPLKQRLLLRARHAWWRFNRDTRGLPNRYVYFPVRWLAIRARRALSDPQYWALHAKRAWKKFAGR
jgi:hypothetical protein